MHVSREHQLQAASLERADLDWVEEALVYAWAASIVVDPRWPELDEQLKLRVRLARALEGPRCVKKRSATDMDALAYLHTASLSQPFNQTWFRIYNYLFTKLFPELAEAVLGKDAVKEGCEKVARFDC